MPPCEMFATRARKTLPSLRSEAVQLSSIRGIRGRGGRRAS